MLKEDHGSEADCVMTGKRRLRMRSAAAFHPRTRLSLWPGDIYQNASEQTMNLFQVELELLGG